MKQSQLSPVASTPNATPKFEFLIQAAVRLLPQVSAAPPSVMIAAVSVVNATGVAV